MRKLEKLFEKNVLHSEWYEMAFSLTINTLLSKNYATEEHNIREGRETSFCELLMLPKKLYKNKEITIENVSSRQ